MQQILEHSSISWRVLIRVSSIDENVSVGLIHGEPYLHFLLVLLAHSSQIVCQTISDSFAPQGEASHDTLLPVRTSRFSVKILSQNETPVRFLGHGSIFVCASTSSQVCP